MKVYYDQFSYICNPLQDQMNWRKFKFSDLKEVKKLKMNESDYEYYSRKEVKKEVSFIDKIPYFEVKEVDFSKIKYFDVQVVKVKKGEKTLNIEKKQGECKVYTEDRKEWCGKCPRIPKSKGNIVNGENLDKIKFPCFCSYSQHGSCVKKGMITKGFNGKFYYELHYMDNQINAGYTTTVDTEFDLGKLIKDYDVHIRKGKVIIFDEEEG